MKVIQGKKYRCLCEVKEYSKLAVGYEVEPIRIERDTMDLYGEPAIVIVKSGVPISLPIFMSCFEPCEE